MQPAKAAVTVVLLTAHQESAEHMMAHQESALAMIATAQHLHTAHGQRSARRLVVNAPVRRAADRRVQAEQMREEQIQAARAETALAANPADHARVVGDQAGDVQRAAGPAAQSRAAVNPSKVSRKRCWSAGSKLDLLPFVVNDHTCVTVVIDCDEGCCYED
jgi:hypothetical protein